MIQLDLEPYRLSLKLISHSLTISQFVRTRPGRTGSEVHSVESGFGIDTHRVGIPSYRKPDFDELSVVSKRFRHGFCQSRWLRVFQKS